MTEKLQKLFSPPFFKGDEDETRLAGNLHAVLAGVIVGTGLSAIKFILENPSSLPRFMVLIAVIPLTYVVARLMHHGWIRFASILLSSVLFIMLGFLATVSGGVVTPAYFGLITVVLMAGLLLGFRAGIVYTVLSLLTGFALVIAEAEGILPQPAIVTPPSSRLLSQGIFVTATLVTVYLAKQNIQIGLRSAQQNLARQKQIENTLRKSEARYQSIFDGVRDAIFVESLDSEILFANERACEMYGWSREEFLTKTVMDLVPEEKFAFAPRVSTDEDLPNHPIETINVRANGEHFPAEITVRLQEIAEEKVMLVVVRDITARKQSEMELRKLSQAVNQSPSLVIITDPEGNIEYVNPKFSKVTGYSFEEVIGKNPRIVKSGETPPEKYKELWETIKSGHEWHGEFHNKKKNGEFYWASVSISPVYNEQGVITHFNCVQEDITKRKHALEAIHYQSQIERLVATISKKFLSIKHVEIDEEIETALKDVGQFLNALRCSWVQKTTDGTSYEITHDWCAEGVKSTKDQDVNFRPTEFPWLFGRLLVGEVVQILDDDDIPADSKAEMEFIAQYSIPSLLQVPIISNGDLVGFLSMTYSHAQSPIPVNAIPLLKITAEIIKNAKDRKETEEALLESEERFRHLSEAAFEGIGITDKGRVIDTNPQLAQMLGYEQSEILGLHVIDMVAPESREKVIENMKNSSQAPYEHFALKKDGSTIPVEVRGRTMPYAGKLVRVTAIRDITKYKKVEEELLDTNRRLEGILVELKTAQEQALTQERLAAVGQLAAGVAHDFNNILVPITLYAQMLLIESEPSHKAKERLETILKQAKRASTLTDQLLDFSRRAVMDLQTLDIVQFLKEFSKLLRRTLPESIRIELLNDDEDYILNADPARMQQVFMNLALNARDAMPNGGDLRVELSKFLLEPDQMAPYRDMPPGLWVQIKVTDTGTGISAENLQRIFEPFFTTKEIGEGTGLGLAQVYGIIKQHNGYITAESELNVGTTFMLYLPSALEHKFPEEFTEAEMPSTGSQQIVLVVEDNDAVRTAMFDILSLLKYRVVVAKNGRAALEIFKREKIDLVLSDLIMPEMGGVELFERLRKMDSNVKLVLLTGYPMREEIKKLTEEQAVEWVQKPLDMEEVSATVQKALSGSGSK